MISNVNASGAAAAVDASQTARRRPFDREKAMAPVAELLGMSTDDLRAAQKSGKTLDQLAAAKGISHADLVGAIKKGLQQAGAGAAPTAGGAGAVAGTDPLDQIAENIATGKANGGGHHHHPRPAAGTNAPDTAMLENVASILQMPAGDVVSALTKGTSLPDLAKQQGVSSDDLLKAVGNGMVLKTYA